MKLVTDQSVEEFSQIADAIQSSGGGSRIAVIAAILIVGLRIASVIKALQPELVEMVQAFRERAQSEVTTAEVMPEVLSALSQLHDRQQVFEDRQEHVLVLLDRISARLECSASSHATRPK